MYDQQGTPARGTQDATALVVIRKSPHAIGAGTLRSGHVPGGAHTV
jgi:hypothetical protein